MIRPDLLNTLEDRIAIKATQYLRRRLKPKEISEFFRKKQGKIENLDQEFIKKLDAIMKEYLDEISNN